MGKLRFELWTDGSGTVDGPMGWAYILRAIDEETGEVKKEREASGYELDGTNNRAEMTALLEGLRALTRPCKVLVRTDSEYVMNAWVKNWFAAWERRGWARVKNIDLWRALLDAAAPHDLSFEWCKGHAGVEANERCDELAGEARQRAFQLHAPWGAVVGLNSHARSADRAA